MIDIIYDGRNEIDATTRRIIDWKSNGFIWHDWELSDGSLPIAKLRSKKRLVMFEGRFNSHDVLIRSRLDGSVMITEADSKENIGGFDSIFPTPVVFTLANGRRFTFFDIERSIFGVEDEKGRLFAKTVFNIQRTPVKAAFEFVDFRVGDLDPGATAVLGLYVAIKTSYSNG